MYGRRHDGIHCVAVVDETLPPGLAANAVGVLALTLGATVPTLAGADFSDADGETHPGLIPQGLPVLAAPRGLLRTLRTNACAAGLGVVDFPSDGQRTTDYEEFRRRVARTPSAGIDYLGLIVYGPRAAVGSLTGSLALLR